METGIDAVRKLHFSKSVHYCVFFQCIIVHIVKMFILSLEKKLFWFLLLRTKLKVATCGANEKFFPTLLYGIQNPPLVLIHLSNILQRFIMLWNC